MSNATRPDLFESPAKVLVNTVNTVGVMGKGIARTFKDVYPEMFRQYQQLCEKKRLHTGKLWLYKTDHKWILNFPTKVHWRQPSKPQYVEEGLKTFVSTYAVQGITSVAFPKLGCGNGELDWEGVVQPMMIQYLANLAIEIFVYDFDRDYARPEHKDIEAMTAWLRSEPRALAFEELWTDLCKLIGLGLELDAWDGSAPFKASVVTEPSDGLLLQVTPSSKRQTIATFLKRIVTLNWSLRLIGPGSIFVPQEALLDLWQNIRAYGFCVPRIMPAGLDFFAPHVLALLSRLDYMKPVQLSLHARNKAFVDEKGLRLFVAPPRSHAGIAQPVLAVHPL
jgi:O-acetyl-ADP-ribose deacetylase (regulator of RNase III)